MHSMMSHYMCVFNIIPIIFISQDSHLLKCLFYISKSYFSMLPVILYSPQYWCLVWILLLLAQMHSETPCLTLITHVRVPF